MTDATWNAPHARALGVMLAGDAITELDARGERVRDDTLLILLNAARRRRRLHAAREAGLAPGSSCSTPAAARHARARAATTAPTISARGPWRC